MDLNNKWIRGVLPSLLIHGSIGSVYAWSLLVNPIANYTGHSNQSIQFAFSLAIFFLGMSSAFGGKFVEKNIKNSSLVSMIFFVLGLLVTGVSVYAKSLVGIYIGYGFLMGIGLGVGYITPVKSLMMWFKDRKGLATGIAIMSFGFASLIASPLITYLLSKYSLPLTFVLLGIIYAIPMYIAHLIIKKPNMLSYPNEEYSEFKLLSMFKNIKFIAIWFMMYLNISCGLALISVASPMMAEKGLSIGLIATIVAVMGLTNGFGRLGFSTLADLFKDRTTVYKIIFTLSVLTVGLSILFPKTIVITLLVISACYGAGFSNLPSLLSDKFGMKNISAIHGLSLTAWAMAGLTGNQISAFVFNKTHGYSDVLFIIQIGYILALAICSIFIINKKNQS